MKLKRYILASLSVPSLFLAACDGESLEDIENSAAELEELHASVVEELNGLYQDETALQETFSETLETDEDLSTLADGSSPVFENIEQRTTRLSNLEELEAQIQENADSMHSYEGETLSSEELEGIANEVEMFTDHLEVYREQYTESLSTQETYFENIAAEDATYDIFSEGIQEINEQREGLQAYLIDLDDSLVTFDEVITQLHEALQEATAEGE
jgi:chromosome segregation ATPase